MYNKYYIIGDFDEDKRFSKTSTEKSCTQELK